MEASNTVDIALNADGFYMKIDTNNDNEIQFSEALQVYKLNVDGEWLTNIDGVEHFTNLRVLVASFNWLSSVNVSTLVNLEYLNLWANGLSSINIQPLTALKHLDVSSNAITNINLAGLNNLEYLDVGSNLLTSLTVEGASYKELDFSGNNISSIDISGLPNLEYIKCGGNPLLTSLNFNALHKLSSLDCSHCPLTNIDLSNCPDFFSLILNDGNVETINLKNGGISYYDFSHSQIFYLPNLKYVCVDENEQSGVEQFFTNNFPEGQIPSVNSYCTTGLGGNYNTISGTFRFDADSNGCTPADANLPYIKIAVTDGTTQSFAYTDAQGHYTIPVIAGSYTITPVLDSYFAMSPASEVVNFTSANNSAEIRDFCVASNGNHNDVSATIEPFIGARPGFDASYKFLIKNKGNQTASGNIIITFPDDMVDYISSSVNVTINGNTISIPYSNLLPFEKRDGILTFNVNSPMETPAVNIGDVLNYGITITSAGDENIADNTFNLQQTVVGSFDPNDMVCLDGEIVHPDKIGDFLHYKINFENTGNFPATFVVVKDEVDTAKFDISTMQIINASHPMTAKITGNKMEFRFDDINLAPQGKGYIVFKIKTRPTVAINSAVTQNAEIFFDYNHPIGTNYVYTTFTTLGLDSFIQDNTVSVYPNPSKGTVTIKANSEIRLVELYDVQGRLLQSTGTTSIDIAQRSPGMYFLKIYTDKGVKTEKLIRE